MKTLRFEPHLAIGAIGAIASPFSLGGGVGVAAADAPVEHCAAISSTALAFALGHGNADGHADAYFDAALPAQWLAGFAVGAIAGNGDSDSPLVCAPDGAAAELGRGWKLGREAALGRRPEEALAVAAGSLPARVREASLADRARFNTNFDAVSFRLKGTHVEIAVASFEGESRVSYGVLGDIALFRYRSGHLERIDMGGTLADDMAAAAAAGAASSLNDLGPIGRIVTSFIDGLDGAIHGVVRRGALELEPKDVLCWTSKRIHREVSESRLERACANGCEGIETLRTDLAKSGTARSWPSAVFLTKR